MSGSAKSAAPVRREPAWTRLDDEALLDKRFCDLRLKLSGTWLEDGINRLYGELDAKGIGFRPHFWLSEEWFSPDGVPGIAIPFYLVHQRLMRLERRFMHQVEGGNEKWLMRILRHEAGHAIDTAYGLRRRKAWRETFGKASRRYPNRYFPRPASRNFVLHLGHWYAQSHPTEDFAETFAVWLPRRARWRSRYQGWPALAKLEFVDQTVRALEGRRAVRDDRHTIEPLEENLRSLREHYRRKQARYEVDTTRSYDRRLLKLFAPADESPDGLPASRFLRETKPLLRRQLVSSARMHPYMVSHVLRTATLRARLLDLRLKG
ncbi:MAG: putative zinc-binding metallopeptidase, partial [Steroidobacteraceae bacterium]|nr:putative zinc-binding metallopeptidase [Steroidobacteraceae bacterium]